MVRWRVLGRALPALQSVCVAASTATLHFLGSRPTDRCIMQLSRSCLLARERQSVVSASRSGRRLGRPLLSERFLSRR